jgi:hypothetical protein
MKIRVGERLPSGFDGRYLCGCGLLLGVGMGKMDAEKHHNPKWEGESLSSPLLLTACLEFEFGCGLRSLVWSLDLKKEGQGMLLML